MLAATTAPMKNPCRHVSFTGREYHAVLSGRKLQDVPDTTGWRFGSDTGNVFDLKLGQAGGAVEAQSAPGQPINTWLRVAIVIDPGARMEAWLNGRLAATRKPPPAAFVDEVGSHAFIGCRKDGNFALGKLDEVRIYLRALSENELQ